MSSIDRTRAGAEARSELAAKPGEVGRHEDELLRYLGAMYYEVRHGRAGQEELEQAVSEVDTQVDRHGPLPVTAKPDRVRRRWWTLRSGSR